MQSTNQWRNYRFEPWGKLRWMKPTGRRVARNFDRHGANNNQASTFEYLKPLFLKIHPWNMHFSGCFFVIFQFRFMPANKKYLFIELTSFKSLFLVTLFASTLHRRLHLFIKFSRWSACENLDAISARSAVCFFQAILQLCKTLLLMALWLRFLYLRASDVHHHTFDRSPVAALR